ncbi:MAG: hypothetical protein CMB32_04135 [Euryarchaeota archaeon]|nr:hypothetical protein [Euryarchaeota archaeon]
MPLFAHAQLLDVSSDLALNTDHTGGYIGAGVSFVDFNQDGYDDLTFGHHEGELKFYEGTGNSFNEVNLGIDNLGSETKGVYWIDFDNDADLDFFTTNRLAPNKIWRNDGGSFTDISESSGIDQTLSKSYGMSFGDYDNDGLLDFYICNYQLWVDTGFENELYHNNGDGTFTNVTATAGVGNGLKQSFQATWIDINLDGFLDLHVVNYRHEFKNAFYINNGDGTFTDMAQSLGTDLEALAMCSSFEDFDKDGDMDLFVSNGLDGNFMLKNKLNEFGYFVDESSIYGIEVNDYCWAGEWIDYNNDTWPDLHVSKSITVYTDYPDILDQIPPTNDLFFINNGMAPFNTIPGTITLNDHHSFATAQGDFNNDGVPDLVSHRVGETAAFYKGVPTSNNWIKINLIGTSSNINGVGCSIKLYRTLFTGQIEPLSKVVFAGDNYLGQDSYTQHFGLGTSAEIANIIVTWSDGSQVEYGAFNVNQEITLTEPEPLVGCTYQQACNYNENAITDDGSCDLTCLCGENLVWDIELEQCIPLPTCPSDIDHSGETDIQDLLVFLTSFGEQC